ncbi:MAG: hypothetical protein QF535_22405, partial [Anaerolineales bacterium]|nr:hypothetical protein [Anaerolineales bacterium]
DNAAVDRSSPVKVGSLTTWAEVLSSSGSTYGTSFAIKTDGTLWAWGQGTNGKLGKGNATSYSSPVKVGSLTNWSQAHAGQQSSAMIKTDGTLWVMGKGTNGRLGQGDTANRSSPVQVGSATNWATAFAGYAQTAAINTLGELWICGYGTKGELGQNNTTSYSSLVQVDGSNWDRISGGANFCVATRTDGTLWSWGGGVNGKTGHGDTADRSSPTQIGSLTDWDFPGPDVYGQGAHAVKTDGTAWSWGTGTTYGAIGDNATITRSSPVQVGGATDWQNVTKGNSSVGGIRKINNNAGYALWTWGVGSFGSTGHNDTVARSSPTQLGTLNEWSKYIAMVYKGMLGVKVDGTLWAWGKNNDGQLGLGNTTTFSSPMQVGNDGNWAKVKGGTTFTIATKTDGTLWGWGNGNNGATGHGNTTDYSVPIQVGSLTDWSDISVASNYTTVAVKTDGTLWAWGKNDNGQIGDGSTTARSSPVQIGSLTTWSKAVTEGETTLALNTGGEIFGWGRNNRGQAGLGDTVKTSSPVQIGSLTNWADIATMGSSTYGNGFAINTDGELFSWGDGYAGTTGQGNATDYSSPVQVGTLTDWASLPLDTQTTNEMTAIKTDGTLWGWGKNSSGRIGIGNTTKYSSPVQVGSGGGWASSSIGTGLQASLRRPTVADGTTSGYL